MSFSPMSSKQEEMRAIRTRRWAYFKYIPGSDNYRFEDELYNLAEDLGEKNDLSKRHPDKVSQLHQKLKAWRKQLDAKMPPSS